MNQQFGWTEDETVTAHGTFYWNELATTDTEAARAFYAALVGWKTQETTSRS